MAPRAGMNLRSLAHCSAYALLTVMLLCSPASGADGHAAVVMSGSGCSDEGLHGQIRRLVGANGPKPLSPGVVASALARVRSARALTRARKLYIDTDFGGCAALLSISERELSRSIGDHRAEVRGRAHRLLAEINLWLGVCQWLSDKKDPARESFKRSAQLPSPPLPDEGAFPPEVVKGYRESVRSPARRVDCSAEVLRKAHVRSVDGRDVQEGGQGLQLDEGQHYLVWATVSRSGNATETSFSAQRVAVKHGECRLAPKAGKPVEVACASPQEAADATFAADVCAESGSATSLTVGYDDGGFSARVVQAGDPRFYRQLKGVFEDREQPADAVMRSLAGLFAHAGQLVPCDQVSTSPWYGKWWVWTAVAVVAVSVGVTVVAVTR